MGPFSGHGFKIFSRKNMGKTTWEKRAWAIGNVELQPGLTKTVKRHASMFSREC